MLRELDDAVSGNAAAAAMAAVAGARAVDADDEAWSSVLPRRGELPWQQQQQQQQHELDADERERARARTRSTSTSGAATAAAAAAGTVVSNGGAAGPGPGRTARGALATLVAPPPSTPTKMELQRAAAAMGSDGDPMFRALLENLVTLEAALKDVRDRAMNLDTANALMLRRLEQTASCLARWTAEDEAGLGPSAAVFARTAERLMDSPYERWATTLQNKVLEPIRVNLGLMEDIMKRAQSLDALKRRSTATTAGARPPVAGDMEAARELSRVFDELSTLHTHRLDFVRGPFEALKAAQHRFVQDVARELEGPAAMHAPRVVVSSATPKAVKSSSVAAVAAPVSAAALQPPPPQQQPRIAVTGSRFDPNADKVKARGATAFEKRASLPPPESAPTTTTTPTAPTPPTAATSDITEFETV